MRETRCIRERSTGSSYLQLSLIHIQMCIRDRFLIVCVKFCSVIFFIISCKNVKEIHLCKSQRYFERYHSLMNNLEFQKQTTSLTCNIHFNYLGCNISYGTDIDWDSNLTKVRRMCGTVSYTHLDVYKRQNIDFSSRIK